LQRKKRLLSPDWSSEKMKNILSVLAYMLVSAGTMKIILPALSVTI
jgi:hypothetical protein